MPPGLTAHRQQNGQGSFLFPRTLCSIRLGKHGGKSMISPTGLDGFTLNGTDHRCAEGGRNDGGLCPCSPTRGMVDGSEEDAPKGDAPSEFWNRVYHLLFRQVVIAVKATSTIMARLGSGTPSAVILNSFWIQMLLSVVLTVPMVPDVELVSETKAPAVL